jgi:hypothetical protein
MPQYTYWKVYGKRLGKENVRYVRGREGGSTGMGGEGGARRGGMGVIE